MKPKQTKHAPKMPALKIALTSLMALACLIFPGTAKLAHAACTCGALVTCSASSCLHKETRKQVKDFIDKEFENHQDWIEKTWWEENLLPALQAMTEQINAGQQQVVATDSAVQTTNMQRNNALATQEQVADVSHEISPSDGLCEALSGNVNVVGAQIAAADTAERAVQHAEENFSGTPGSANEPGRIADLNARALIECLPQYRAQYPDAQCDDTVKYTSATEAINQDGQVSPNATTATSQAINQFVAGFAPPPATSYNADVFSNNRAARLAWQNRRSLNAAASIAARCYMKAVAGNTVAEGSDWTDQQKAAMRELGMSDQDMEAFPFNAQNHRRFLTMVSNSTARGEALIDTQENAQRVALVTQGSNMPILYDMLEQSLCSEMMTSLMLNTVTQPLKAAAEEKATNIALRTDEQANKTRYASSE